MRSGGVVRVDVDKQEPHGIAHLAVAAQYLRPGRTTWPTTSTGPSLGRGGRPGVMISLPCALPPAADGVDEPLHPAAATSLAAAPARSPLGPYRSFARRLPLRTADGWAGDARPSDTIAEREPNSSSTRRPVRPYARHGRVLVLGRTRRPASSWESLAPWCRCASALLCSGWRRAPCRSPSKEFE